MIVEGTAVDSSSHQSKKFSTQFSGLLSIITPFTPIVLIKKRETKNDFHLRLIMRVLMIASGTRRLDERLVCTDVNVS